MTRPLAVPGVVMRVKQLWETEVVEERLGGSTDRILTEGQESCKKENYEADFHKGPEARSAE